MAAGDIVASLAAIDSAVQTATKSMNDLNEKALKGGLGIKTLIDSVNSGTKALTDIGNAAGLAGSAITFGLDFGLISKSMSGLSGIFKTVLDSTSSLVSIYNDFGLAMDSVSGYSRQLNTDLFEQAAKFHGSFDAAKKFSDYIISSATDFATAEAGFISPAERTEAIKGLAAAGIPLEHMGDIIESSAGKMDLLNAAFLHSKSLGMSVADYMSSIGEAMLVQGLTSQQAAEQMALFGETSSKTGLRVEKVSSTLKNIAGRFSKLGMTADFGTPILEGFAKTLSSMGLGFENAIGLSETLSNSLAELTSNYSAAYITFQRGGLDMGNSAGGGALGASIGLRSEMLKANETGTQGDLAMKLAGAMKDTLASFAGGQIVTVTEAAENPELQNAFYTQTKLLENLYNISSSQDQDRTLDLLQQLGVATEQGNTDLAASLGNDLKDVLGMRDETMSYEAKTATYTEATFAELQNLNKNLIREFGITGANMVDLTTGIMKTAMDSSKEGIKSINNDPNSLDFSKLVPTSDALLKGSKEIGNIALSGMRDVAEYTSDSLSGLGETIASALANTPLKISNIESDLLIGALTSKVGELVDQIKILIPSRN